MKGSGGFKKQPQSPGRKNPSVPRSNQQRSSSNSRDKRCPTPSGKCRGNRSPPTSSKRSCGKAAAQPARKSFSPVRGTGTTRKAAGNPVKSKKQTKNTKPLHSGKITQTTPSLITGEDKIFVLDAAAELEHILGSDARSREEADIALTTSADIEIPCGNVTRTEPKYYQSEDMVYVPSTMVTQLSNRLSSRENECVRVPCNAPNQDTEIREDIEGSQLPPPTSEDSDGNTLDIHITSLRHLINAKSLQNENFSIVSQLKGNSIISTGEGRVTISTGDKRIIISSVEGRQAPISVEGSGSIDEQSNFSTEASVLSQPVHETNVASSSRVKTKISTIIIESQSPCYSNSEEEERKRSIQNDPMHPLARRTLSSPARSEVPMKQRPPPQLKIKDRVSPTVYTMHAQEDYKSKILQNLTSSARDYDGPSRTTPETTVSEVSKFVLEVDLNKSVTNPEYANSVKSKFAVSSIGSRLESGTSVGWPCTEEEESKDQGVKGPVTNNTTVCKSPVDVELKVPNKDPENCKDPPFLPRCDQDMSQRSFKPLPLIASDNKPRSPVSATWNISQTTNNSKITPDQDILKAREGVVYHHSETHSIEDIEPCVNETCEYEKSKKIRESKEISYQSKTKLTCEAWETREANVRRNNIEYPPKGIGCNFDSTVRNIIAGTSIGSPNRNRRSSSPPVTSEFQNYSGNIVDIVQENKENEIQKIYADVKNSTVVNHRNKGKRTPCMIGSTTFSANDIIIPGCGNVNKTPPQSKILDKNIRIEQQLSEKTSGSYVTVKDSKSYTITEMNPKKGSYSTDQNAQRQYFDVNGILGGESGLKMDPVNVTNDSRSFGLRDKRKQVVKKPSGGTDDKSGKKQWEESDEIQIKLTQMSLEQTLSPIGSSNSDTIDYNESDEASDTFPDDSSW